MTTTFSPCRTYRYTLWRDWSDLMVPSTGYLMIIGLNPSTADETQDDPTIRRCIGFAKAWGFTALCMTNLFAFRATDPKDMKAAADPIGPDNDHHLHEKAAGAGMVLAAWGNHGSHLGRAAQVIKTISNLHCLRANADGSPQHPLYLPAHLKPQKYPVA